MTGRAGSIGVAIIGCGVVGRMRAVLLSELGAVGWLGVADIDRAKADEVAAASGADFVTTDAEELIRRPEVDAVIVATPVSLHAMPVLAAVEHGRALFIEKPLATDPVESAEILERVTTSGVDAVVGYSQRFRRRFLGAKQRIADGVLGDITTVMARVMMNRAVGRATLRLNADKKNITPMVIGGTHTLDICSWFLGDRRPVSVFAAANDRVFGADGSVDATLGVFTMDDGTVFSLSINWALPDSWPGAVYGLQVGVVGTHGALDIEDTHRDVVLATDHPLPQPHPSGGTLPDRYVDFLGSYPPGEKAYGGLWGSVRDETLSWASRVSSGSTDTPHATVQEAHDNLVMSMAMDLSARRGAIVDFPVTLEDLQS